TVRVDVELLDNLMNLVGELVIDRTRLAQVLGTLESCYEDTDLTEDLNRTSIHIGRVITQLQEEIMKARMLPVESLFNKFPRMMRDLSQKAGKEVDFFMEGQETELDRSIIEEIGDPLIHLLRNSIDHAIETPEERKAAGKNPKGTIKLSAHHEENHINIVVKDDGRGIDPEKVRAAAVKKGLIAEDVAHRLSDQEAIHLIFASGLSTANKVSDISGRGVGMDVVRTNLEKVGGAIEIHTEEHKGTEIKIKLPLTLAIIRALLVNMCQRVYAIPLTSVLKTIRITNDQIMIINKREAIVVRGNVLPLLRFQDLFNIAGSSQEEKGKTFVVVVNLAGQQLGIAVDALVGEQEVVIKSLGKFIGDVQGIAGATILGDGSVALIIDIPSLMKKFTAIAS
ncbi:MAG: chemotaxis protein CheA, partial [Thermincolia bacterium]